MTVAKDLNWIWTINTKLGFYFETCYTIHILPRLSLACLSSLRPSTGLGTSAPAALFWTLAASGISLSIGGLALNTGSWGNSSSGLNLSRGNCPVPGLKGLLTRFTPNWSSLVSSLTGLLESLFLELGLARTRGTTSSSLFLFLMSRHEGGSAL